MPRVPVERIPKEKMKPADLFRRFYFGLGFTITTALFAAGYLATRQHDSFAPLLFFVAAGAAFLWGVCWGAWDSRLFKAWAFLATLSVIALLGAGFVDMSHPGLMATLFGCGGGIFVAWAATSAIKLANS